MKKVAIAVLLTVSLLAAAVLSGCSGGISGDEAKAHINGFFDAIEEEDYEKAATFLHPERPGDLQAYFEEIESEEFIDFSPGIEIVRYTGFSSSYYDSTVGGSTYALEMDVSVGGEDIEVEIELVRNDAGFGIYNLDIDT